MARLRDDIRRLRFWRSVISEFLGCMFLVLIGCGAWTVTETTVVIAGADGAAPAKDVIRKPDPVRVALAFGFTYMAMLYCVRNVCDSHLNPSITLALLVTRRTSFVRFGLYIIAQLLGSILGAAFIVAVTDAEYRKGGLGCTVPAPRTTEGHCFGVEFFASFFFVFVVFACYDRTREEEAMATPFVIGITYAAVLLFAVPYTGGSLNSARSFGPALVNNVWHAHWVYWFGPLFGGLAGGALYDLIFSTKASFKRLRACLLVFHHKDEDGQRTGGTPGSHKGDAETGNVGPGSDEEGESPLDEKTVPLAESDDDLDEKRQSKDPDDDGTGGPGVKDGRRKPRIFSRPKFTCCK